MTHEDLTKAHQTIYGILVIALFVAAMVGAAIVGDNNQQERLADEYAELEAERIRIEHEIREHRHANPNTSRCGHACIARLPTQPESWEWEQQQ